MIGKISSVCKKEKEEKRFPKKDNLLDDAMEQLNIDIQNIEDSENDSPAISLRDWFNNKDLHCIDMLTFKINDIIIKKYIIINLNIVKLRCNKI